MREKWTEKPQKSQQKTTRFISPQRTKKPDSIRDKKQTLLWLRAELGREGGDDETAEGGIELIRRCAEELGIGSRGVAIRQFAVLGIAILPVCETFEIGHLGFANGYRLREGADGTFAALGERACIWIKDCVGVRTTVAGAHDDTLFR